MNIYIFSTTFKWLRVGHLQAYYFLFRFRKWAIISGIASSFIEWKFKKTRPGMIGMWVISLAAAWDGMFVKIKSETALSPVDLNLFSFTHLYRSNFRFPDNSKPDNT